MNSDNSAPTSVELVSEAINGLASKAAEALILIHTADPMLAAAMGGAAGGTAKGLFLDGQRLLARRRERLERALAVAHEQSGLNSQELLEHALNHDDERRLDLLLGALRAASQEVVDERVAFYGRIAASGVLERDDAKVDAQIRVFGTIARLDPADLKVLLRVTAPNSPGEWLYERERDARGSTENVLAEQLPELADVLESVVARLETAGLLSSRDPGGGINFGGTRYQVTVFARRCRSELFNQPMTDSGS